MSKQLAIALGSMFSAIFLGPPLGLSQEEREAAVAKLPTCLRNDAEVWILVHLAHLFYLLIANQHGAVFADEVIHALLDVDETKDIGELLSYWIPILATMDGSKSIDEIVNNAPWEIIYAACFLHHSATYRSLTDREKQSMWTMLASIFEDNFQAKFRVYNKVISQCSVNN
jgi:hypothetical protein